MFRNCLRPLFGMKPPKNGRFWITFYGLKKWKRMDFISRTLKCFDMRKRYRMG
jgi:hypothetical protein